MDNRCYSCTSSFGIFKKEVACGKCGFGFCKKCLPHQVKLSSSKAGPVPVCNKCFQSLQHTNTQKTAAEGTKYDEVPENFKKRVAALQTKEGVSRNPVKGKDTQKLSKTDQKLSPADQDIASRLAKLKADKNQAMGQTASVDEMEARLRALKGLPSKSEEGHQSQVYQAPDTRTGQEQAQDLMQQMKEEVNLDNKLAGSSSKEGDDQDEVTENDILDSQENVEKSLEDEVKGVLDEAKRELKEAEEGRKTDAEMEERLAKLSGMDLQTFRDKGKKSSENMSETEATKRYIAKLLEESRLDEKMEADGYSKLMQDSKANRLRKEASVDPDELPWCCICNEDANVRCHDCDDDLYCKSCFREGHNEFDMKHHRVSKFRAPREAER